MATMPGDVLLAGAFMAYIGFFDHYYRSLLLKHWRQHLERVGFSFRNDLFLSEFLSKPSERMAWQSNSLPSDDLCTENAIILKRFHRYPLIIDPSGQALEFILSFYADKKITKSSFSDEAFLKSFLEPALRFGSPLLVQDVEKIDPILNSVLNNEIHRTGGRVLIRVGDQEIDFSPSFSMFMITRDSNAKFTPDLCSRVTFVNFTVTPSSLKEQCLNIYLRNERPDVEEKRISLLKLQGEYLVKLRDLEDSLLNAISQAQGNILENDPLLHSLENLKSEASKIQEEMAKSDKVMQEVQDVTSTYEKLSSASSKIYFSLVSMKNVNYLYDYSLTFFMETIFNLLQKSTELSAIPKSKPDERLEVLYNEVFVLMYKRVTLSILSQDKLIVMMTLLKIKLGPEFAEFIVPLIKSSTILEIEDTNLLKGKLTSNQLKTLEDLRGNLRYRNLISHIHANENAWLNLLSAITLEGNIPSGWEDQEYEAGVFPSDPKSKEIANQIKDLTIIKALRPDKLENWALKLLAKVMGPSFSEDPPIDMQHIVTNEANCKTPVLMYSGKGNDPSQKVDALARTSNKKYTSVAIGSPEGFVVAEKTLQSASKAGHWLLLKNVHLAPSWLNELEKKIHRLTGVHEGFRLFLTMEINPNVPETLIRQSYKLVFEAPDGIKATMQRTYHTVIPKEKGPNERARLHFLMAWMHAVVLERLRYIPIGWSKWYEFNEADQRCSIDLIDEYIDSLGERNNISPDRIPWPAIRCMLVQNLYGGKIDNEYDQMILAALVNQFFNEKVFAADYTLFHSTEVEPIKVPEAIKNAQYLEWVNALPDVESPAWSGLPLTVERILKEKKTERTLSKLWELQDTGEEEVTLESSAAEKENSGQVQWLRTLGQRAAKYLELLPVEIGKLERTGNSLNNPLFRFLEREITVATSLLETVRTNLFNIKEMCEGKINSTNVLKTMAKTLYSENIPSTWVKFPVLKMNVNDWMLDFKKRLDQFSQLMKEREYQKRGVWFGGLFFPEAFLTATRQLVAQDNKWSLDELQLSVSVHDGNNVADDCFLISEMVMEGGMLKNSGDIENSNIISNPLPMLKFQWKKVDKSDEGPSNCLKIPVYLNKERRNLVTSLYLGIGGLNETVLYQKGVALVAWAND